MNFSDYLQENSLFGGKDNATKDQVMEDNEKIMNSLVFNYFGFLGLVHLNSKSGFLKTYQQSDKISGLNSITDESNDVALSMKLALDAGCIKQSSAIRMTKILQQIKQKKLDGETLTDVMVRSLLDDIKYTTFKPSPRLLMVLKDFHSGTISLPIFTKKLYILSKQKDYTNETLEFRTLVIKGQYLKLFTEVSDSELTSSNVPSSTSPVNAATGKPEIATQSLAHPDKQVDAFFFKKP
jgi:hypothetical protein